MTGGITGELVGDVANQGLQRKKKLMIMRQHQKQGQHKTQKANTRVYALLMIF